MTQTTEQPVESEKVRGNRRKLTGRVVSETQKPGRTKKTVVVMVVRQEDRRRLRQHRAPQARHIRLGKPGQEPRVEQQESIALPVQQCGMTEVNRIAIAGTQKPMLANGSPLRGDQTVVLREQFHEFRQQALAVPSCRRNDGLNGSGRLRAVQHTQ